MTLNWNIEVLFALIGFFFFSIFSLIFFYLALYRKHKIHFSLFIVFINFTFFHLFETTAYLFINTEIKRISAVMYSIGLFSLILAVDMFSKDKLSYWKSVLSSFIIGCTIVLALIPENIDFYYHKIFGYPTLGFANSLRIVNIFTLFLVGFQLIYWFYKVWRKAPSESKKKTFYLFLINLIFYICILILFLTGLWLIIPIGYLIASGSISIVIIFVVRFPKLIYILSFSTYRITVISNHSGIPLFNLSWSLKSDKPDDEQILLAKWLPILQQLSLKFAKSLKVEEIKLKKKILHFKHGKYITATLLSNRTTPALKETFNKFVVAFEERYNLLLKTGLDDNSYYNDAIELINKFFPLGIVSSVNSDNSLDNYFEMLVKRRTNELEQLGLEYKEANRLKSLFIASMSHELRTPLNSIIGFSELLLLNDSHKLNEMTKEYIQSIFDEGLYLLELINRILDISKIEAQKLEIYPIEFEFKNLINSTIQLLSSKISKKHIKINYELSSAIIIYSDENRVRQILLNLIDNAIKFTPDSGEILIKVYVIHSKLHVHIIDNGIGIEKENIGKLFQPFQQLDMSETRKYGGTGLGLYLSQKLVNILGGQITVKSEIDKGSDFHLTILTDLRINN